MCTFISFISLFVSLSPSLSLPLSLLPSSLSNTHTHTHTHAHMHRMVATLTKLGEGAFADVFGCQKEGWKKLAIKVPILYTCSTWHVIHFCVYAPVQSSHVTVYFEVLAAKMCTFQLFGIWFPSSHLLLQPRPPQPCGWSQVLGPVWLWCPHAPTPWLKLKGAMS